jgi:uncharacterized protein (DUF1697 family)
MNDLRALFETIPLSNVTTFIASGNVIFDAHAVDEAALQAKIEKHLKKSLGFEVSTFIRSCAEVEAIARFDPFPRQDTTLSGHSLYVAFLKQPPAAPVHRRLADLRSDIDDLRLEGRQLYWFCRGRMSDSTISGATIEKTIGEPATVRNITTLRRLAERYGTA